MEATDNIEQVAAGLLTPSEPVDADVTETPEPEPEAAPDDQTELEADGEALEDAESTQEMETADEEANEEKAENEETDDAASEGPSITFKVNGEERTATIEEAKQALSGHAYIQQGMRENAEARKQLEQHFHTLQAERTQLAQMVQQVQQGAFQPPQPPSKEMLQTDPIAYWEARAEYEEAAEVYQGQVQQLQQVQAQQAQTEQQMREAYLAEQAQALQTLVPELSDQKQAAAVRDAIMVTAREAYGFSDDELNGIIDARHVAVLNDARKWRELQASKETVAKKAKAARPVTKPAARKGGGDGAKAKRVRERMHQTGSIDDVANFLLTGN